MTKVKTLSCLNTIKTKKDLATAQLLARLHSFLLPSPPQRSVQIQPFFWLLNLWALSLWIATPAYPSSPRGRYIPHNVPGLHSLREAYGSGSGQTPLGPSGTTPPGDRAEGDRASCEPLLATPSTGLPEIPSRRTPPTTSMIALLRDLSDRQGYPLHRFQQILDHWDRLRLEILTEDEIWEHLGYIREEELNPTLLALMDRRRILSELLSYSTQKDHPASLFIPGLNISVPVEPLLTPDEKPLLLQEKRLADAMIVSLETLQGTMRQLSKSTQITQDFDRALEHFSPEAMMEPVRSTLGTSVPRGNTPTEELEPLRTVLDRILFATNALSLKLDSLPDSHAYRPESGSPADYQFLAQHQAILQMIQGPDAHQDQPFGFRTRLEYWQRNLLDQSLSLLGNQPSHTTVLILNNTLQLLRFSGVVMEWALALPIGDTSTKNEIDLRSAFLRALVAVLRERVTPWKSALEKATLEHSALEALPSALSWGTLALDLRDALTKSLPLAPSLQAWVSFDQVLHSLGVHPWQARATWWSTDQKLAPHVAVTGVLGWPHGVLTLQMSPTGRRSLQWLHPGDAVEVPFQAQGMLEPRRLFAEIHSVSWQETRNEGHTTLTPFVSAYTAQSNGPHFHTQFRFMSFEELISARRSREGFSILSHLAAPTAPLHRRNLH